VLGGGLVEGGLVLLGGEPGIGKSTLVLQALAGSCAHGRAILVTGEETAGQVRERSERLSVDADGVEVVADGRLSAAVAAIELHRPAVCAIDSVQTLAADHLEAPAGSVAQVREATTALLRAAKETGTALLLVGQVTKDGGLAGPRTLEHLVDVVVYFEGDENRAERILRPTKNRFGATDEAGILEMRADGLAAADPAALLAAIGEPRAGSCVFADVRGSRVLPVEIQALVAPTEIVPPRRLAVGIDRGRLAQVIAVLSRHARVRLGDQDVFVSVAGGARVTDPASDLAVALAIASAHAGAPLAARTAAFGELGLTGAVRPVGHHARRLGAAAAHGMDVAVVPTRGPGAPSDGRGPARVHEVEAIEDALEAAIARPARNG
jgi:DNA repair protein RadA/Sms